MKIRYQQTKGFRHELNRRVRARLRESGRPERGLGAMAVKTAVILGWLAGSYLLLVFVASEVWQGVVLAVSLGLAMAGVGFNVQHDANHEAWSDRRGVNYLLGLTLDLMGGSSYIWRQKHNYLHHQFTNLTGIDDDLDVGVLARLSPEQTWRWWHRFQHVYMWGLYGLLQPKWILWDDFATLVTGRIGGQVVRLPKGRDLAVLLVFKVVAVMVWLVIPMLLHPASVVLGFFAITSVTLGVTLAVVFQLAHCVEEADFPVPRSGTSELETEWAVHQIETTVDFARSNRLVTWYLGGLNFQVEHHLFPRICHLHYPEVSRIVEETCREMGVRYRAHTTARSALASHYRLLRRLGRRPMPAAVPAAA